MNKAAVAIQHEILCLQDEQRKGTRSEFLVSRETREALIAYAIVRGKPLDTVESPNTLKGFLVERVAAVLRKAYHFPKAKGASERHIRRVQTAQAWYDHIVINNKRIETVTLEAKAAKNVQALVDGQRDLDPDLARILSELPVGVPA